MNLDDPRLTDVQLAEGVAQGTSEVRDPLWLQRCMHHPNCGPRTVNAVLESAAVTSADLVLLATRFPYVTPAEMAPALARTVPDEPTRALTLFAVANRRQSDGNPGASVPFYVAMVNADRWSPPGSYLVAALQLHDTLMQRDCIVGAAEVLAAALAQNRRNGALALATQTGDQSTAGTPAIPATPVGTMPQARTVARRLVARADAMRDVGDDAMAAMAYSSVLDSGVLSLREIERVGERLYQLYDASGNAAAAHSVRLKIQAEIGPDSGSMTRGGAAVPATVSGARERPAVGTVAGTAPVASPPSHGPGTGPVLFSVPPPDPSQLSRMPVSPGRGIGRT